MIFAGSESSNGVLGKERFSKGCARGNERAGLAKKHLRTHPMSTGG
jgi:hypothetical protein